MSRPVAGTFARGILGWTLLVVVIALILIVQAGWSLMAGNQVCFFDYPNTACPTTSDPAVTRLTFACFGLPLIWLGGTLAAFAARDLRRRAARG